MLDLQHHFLGQHLRVREHLGEAHRPAAGHARGIQALNPGLDGGFPDPAIDQGPQALAVAAGSRAQNGPAMMRVRSTTPIPDSGTTAQPAAVATSPALCRRRRGPAFIT